MTAMPPTEGRAGEGVTEALARWVSGLAYADLPDDVLAHGKLCVLDALGCGLYGAAQPWGRIAAEVAVGFSGGGRASLIGRQGRVSPSDAAMANGTAIHGFEIDDIHVASMYHPGAVTVPAGLAVAEAEGLSGREFLTALVAGYEVGIRVGMCAGVSHGTSGLHATGTVGTIGSSAAAARLLGLDAERATHALGIGATQAAGLYSARLGAMAKRFHAGRAAQSGVIAAYLAAHGFTGSRIVLEAPFGGFMSTLHGESDPASILERLGESFETARVGFKAYAACASAHTTIDALEEMMAAGLSAENLERLTIHMSRKGVTNVGWPYRPEGVVSAQMNGYYTAAVKLLDGEAFIDQYREERLADPRVLALIERIRIEHDPELDLRGAAKRHTVRAEARLRDGRTLHAFVEQRRGSAERPLATSEIEAKFRRLAATRLAPGAVEELLELVDSLDHQPDLDRLADLIALRDPQAPGAG